MRIIIIFLFFMFYVANMFQSAYMPSNCFSVVHQGPFTYVFLTNIIDPHDYIIAILIGSSFSLHFYCQLSLMHEFRYRKL